ncbi:MAG: LysM peptidoglycan-binding domain-containing protein, partial [Chloroflexota bacterium]
TGQTTYTVQPGDNLFRIALRFGTSVDALAAANGITNVRLIYVGQALVIPSTTTPPPQTPPPPPVAPDVYVVQPGDTLNRIAARFNTTVSAILAVNNIPNPNIIFVGQRINLPGTTAPAETSTPEPPVTGTQEPEPGETPVIDAEFGYGIEVFFAGQDVDPLVQRVEQLGMEWGKVRVEWRDLEPSPGEIDFTELDTVVGDLDAAGVDILFTVTNAPNWARSSEDENGPPDDLNTFFDFVGTLTARYEGVVDAYQIWDEPNLRRNWNCERRMCDTDYLFMLGESFALIKDIDPDAAVISAGLAPTRFNDRINAIDDRLYLETLLSRGLDTVVDGVGIHPGGEANPPDAECCDQPPGVESHYENNSFFFMNNVEGYRDLMVRYGAGNIPLWVTKFGWGTGEDTTPPSNENQPHYSVNYTSLSEQAIYVPRAFEIGMELDYVGPMFLYNLNGCAVTELGGLQELCYFSLIGPDSDPRPVFTAVLAIEKPVDAAESSGPVTDTGVDAEATEETDMTVMTEEAAESMESMETEEPMAPATSTPAPTATEAGGAIEPIPFDPVTETPAPSPTPGS